MTDESKRQSFDAIDTDHDGRISVAELKASLGNDPDVSDENVATIVRMFDENENQLLDFDEYVRLTR